MQYQTPQFINIEDKIFGPFTFKQFVYLGGGAGLSYVLYSILPFAIALPLIIAIVALSLSLAFYKINNRPFALFIQSYITYLIKDKLYLWRKRQRKMKAKEKIPEPEPQDLPKLTESKLRTLSWSLDVLDTQKNQAQAFPERPKETDIKIQTEKS